MNNNEIYLPVAIFQRETIQFSLRYIRSACNFLFMTVIKNEFLQLPVVILRYCNTRNMILLFDKKNVDRNL